MSLSILESIKNCLVTILRKISRATKNKHFKKGLKIIASIVVIFFVFLGIFFLINIGHAKTLYTQAMAGKDHFLKAQEAVYAQDFARASDNLRLARNNFSDAHQNLEKMKLLKYVPLANLQYQAIDNLLIVGTQLSSAIFKVCLIADDIFQSLNDQEEISFATLSAEKKSLILEKISQTPADFKTAKEEMDIAEQAIEKIPAKGLLGPIKEAIAPIKEQFPLLKELIDQAVPATEALPIILGWPDEKTYLFLLQNNTELRPTGGFIGTYGILKVKDAEMTHFSTDNIYNLDDPVKDTLVVEPPQPIKTYLNQKKWFMRDSNWDPDFPTAAQKVLWFYNQESNAEKNIYGVIAVTPTFIQSLLKITGEIKVNGIDFNSDNLVETLQFQVEKGFMRKGIPLSERKDIISTLSSELMDKILNLPKDRWGELWEVFNENVEQKHILIYLEDPRIEKLVTDEGWAGEVKSFAGDYFMVIDSNMASLKTDLGVKRTIDYSIRRNEQNEFICQLNITYDNQGYFDWKTTRYRTYTRVLVPLGSELLSSGGAMKNDRLQSRQAGQVEVNEANGRTEFGAFIATEPQEKQTLGLTYKLPPNFAQYTDQRKEYGLYIQKQPGTLAHTLNITIDLGLVESLKPLDTNYTGVLPSNTDSAFSEGAIQINSNLLTDQQFTVFFK